MSHETPWPPVSPHAALLSSPSGRKKYEATETSPLKRSATTPSLLDRMRAARNDRNIVMSDQEEDDPDDDEEILQLQLAAIQAKLKLKKLQQSKARASTPAKGSSRPNSSHGTASSTFNGTSWHEQSHDATSQVEVPLSPVRRVKPLPQPKSPSRVLLGIDKGVRATDVSLRRANTTASATRRTQDPSVLNHDRPSSRSSAFNSARSATSARSTTTVENRKSFSERMTEARDTEKNTSSRRDAAANARSKGFTVDQVEMETYRLAAEESHSLERGKSPTRVHRHLEQTRDNDPHDSEQINTGSRHLKKSRTMPNLRESPTRPISQDDERVASTKGDSSLYEGFSQLHLSSRILPHSFLKRTLPMDQFTIYRVPDLLREVKSPAYELPDEVCDYVVFAVIASKSGAMDHKQPPPDNSTAGYKDWERKWEDGSQNQRRFMAFTLTDLKWTVDLYLFGTALPRYHRLTPGTVVAILNPGIMPPKQGREDTGAFSLSLSAGEDTVLEIGTARDLGHCKTIKKDGKECGSWVDSSKTEICEWHLNAELKKTQAGRMGVNTGSNGFGLGGSSGRSFFDKNSRKGNGGSNGLLGREGQRYDRYTQSHFYISRSNTSTNNGHQNSNFTQPNPFGGSESMLERDKDARMQKHFATREKEREIAKKLGSLSSGSYGFGGAGAEYLREKAKNEEQDDSGKDHKKRSKEQPSKQSHYINSAPSSSAPREGEGGTQRSALATRGNLLSTSGPNANGKRTAENVRLSPVKKTRFVTEKGIREAGRESLGVGSKVGGGGDSDGELEIV